MNDELTNTKQSFSDKTTDDVSQFYKTAVNKFKAGDYPEAIRLFQQLNLINNGVNFEFVKCLAGSYHANKEYAAAYFWYHWAYDLDNKANLDCLYYLGLIKFEQNNILIAKKIFNLFLSNCNNKQYSILIKKSKIYLEIIKLKERNING